MNFPQCVTFLFEQDCNKPGEFIMQIICEDGFIFDFSMDICKFDIRTQLKVGKHLARTHNVLEINIPAEFQEIWNNTTPINLLR